MNLLEKLLNFEQHRVLVCGGRTWGYKQNLLPDKEEHLPTTLMMYAELDTLKIKAASKKRKLIIIAGEATGADFFAKKWATKNLPRSQYMGFKPDWDKYHRRAGFIRNKEMRDIGKPDLVIAFGGGIGTRMMIALAKEKDIPTIRYDFE